MVRISIVNLHVYCYSGIKDGITIHLVVKSQNKVSFSFVIVIIMNIKLTPTVICYKKTLPLFFSYSLISAVIIGAQWRGVLCND